MRSPKGDNQRRFLITAAGLEIGETSDVETFIHCAWVLTGSAKEVADWNLRATKELVESLSRSGTHIAFVSSMAAFPEAKSWYGRSKFEAEKWVTDAGGIVVRPGTIYGGLNKGIVGAMDRVIKRVHIAPVFGGKRADLYLVKLERLCETIGTLCFSYSNWTGRVLSVVDLPKINLGALYKMLARDANTWVSCINVPTTPCIVFMRLCESVGLRLPIRSDSLVSLTNANPNPPLEPL